jgi:hypothetical protein
VRELLAIHEFEEDNGLDGPEHKFAKSRQWQEKIVNEVIEDKENQIFDFAHTFKAQDYQRPKPLNGSNHGSRPTAGASSWRIDGCRDPHAPWILFS